MKLEELLAGKKDEVFICIKCHKEFYIIGEFVAGEENCECGGEVIPAKN